MTLRRNISVKGGALCIARRGELREYPLFHFQGVELERSLADWILGTRSLRLVGGGVRVVIPRLRGSQEIAELMNEWIRQARREKRAEVRGRCGLEPFVTAGARRRRTAAQGPRGGRMASSLVRKSG